MILKGNKRYCDPKGGHICSVRIVVLHKQNFVIDNPIIIRIKPPNMVGNLVYSLLSPRACELVDKAVFFTVMLIMNVCMFLRLCRDRN